jgi:integrase
LKWAAQAGRAYVAPALAELREPTPPTRRKRVLTRDELAAILPVLSQSTRAHAAAMQFILLTLARLEEVCGATWREIDVAAATWTLPSERTKNGEPHIIPLSRQAVDLLRQSSNGEPTALVFAGARRSALGNWDRAQKAIHAASGTTGWHRHDLRRTGATLLGNMGVPPHIIEAALNHVSIHSPLAATYNAARYRPDVADALQRLADLLDGIATGGAEILPLRAVAKS